MIDPAGNVVSITWTNSCPSSTYSVVNIIPCDSIPLSFLGSKFSTAAKCLPTNSLGS